MAVNSRNEVAADELRAALQELRELARGIPGGANAARSRYGDPFTRRDGVGPVNVEEVVDDRFPIEVETAAYFVVSEALTNVAKHASASVATVRARLVDQTVEIEVKDDGRGGASAEPAGGLAGLVDRAHALGGRLVIESPPGEGTTLTARIPVGQETESSNRPTADRPSS